MGRVKTAVAVMLVVGLGALVSAPGAVAAPAAIQNLGPATGTVHDRSPGDYTYVTVYFTCPRYTTSYGGFVTWNSYFVDVATRPDLGPDRTLATAFTVAFSGAFPTDAAETQCQSQVRMLRPAAGTYYWQAWGIDCDLPDCNNTGPVSSFVIRDPAANPPPTAPVFNPPQSTYLDSRNVRPYVIRMIRSQTGSGPRALRRRCSRRSPRAVACRLSWRKRSHRFVGRARFVQRSGGWDYYFSGRRINLDCKRGGTRCTRAVRW